MIETIIAFGFFFLVWMLDDRLTAIVRAIKQRDDTDRSIK